MANFSKPSEISKTHNSQNDLSGIGKLSKDIIIGAVKEVENHPVKIAEDVGIGLATSVAVSAYPVIALPIFATALYELAVNHNKLIKMTKFLDKDFNVIENPKKYSCVQVKNANSDFKNVGGSLAQFSAGFAGGIAGQYASTFTTDAIRGFVAAKFSQLEVNLDSLGLVDASSTTFTSLKTTIKSISDQEIAPIAKSIMKPINKGSSLMRHITNGNLHFNFINNFSPLAAVPETHRIVGHGIKELSNKINLAIDSTNVHNLRNKFDSNSNPGQPLKYKFKF